MPNRCIGGWWKSRRVRFQSIIRRLRNFLATKSEDWILALMDLGPSIKIPRRVVYWFLGLTAWGLLSLMFCVWLNGQIHDIRHAQNDNHQIRRLTRENQYLTDRLAKAELDAELSDDRRGRLMSVDAERQVQRLRASAIRDEIERMSDPQLLPAD